MVLVYVTTCISIKVYFVCEIDAGHDPSVLRCIVWESKSCRLYTPFEAEMLLIRTSGIDLAISAYEMPPTEVLTLSIQPQGLSTYCISRAVILLVNGRYVV